MHSSRWASAWEPMLTYGSYLGKHDDIVSSAITISVLDTLIALIACMVLFSDHLFLRNGARERSGTSLCEYSDRAQPDASGLVFRVRVFALLVSRR